MTRRSFLTICAVLVSAVRVFTQSREASADPISGTWTGDMAPKDAPRRATVTMELKFDGKAISGSVTGPELTPGKVVGGTFDVKTGALRFDVEVQNDARTVAVFEGTIVKNTATGRVKLDNQLGDFKITKQ